MAERDTVIVLGADVEGLAAAALLAKRGRRVILVDGASRSGGIHAAQEFHPGFSVPGLLHASFARRSLLAELDLERHGLAWRERAPLTVPGGNGSAFELSGSPRELRGLAGEEEAFERWSRFVARLTPLVQDLLDAPPPELRSPSTVELFDLAKRAFALRRLGEHQLHETLRVAPSSASDWLSESFADPALQAALAASALTGTLFGPRAPGTSALVLLSACAEGPEPRGGLAALVKALDSAAQALGVEFQLGRKPLAIDVDSSGVRGLEVEGGERIPSSTLVSALDPKRTLLELLPAGVLDPSVEAAVRTFRSRGALASLRIALSRAPSFAFAVDGACERVQSARSLIELERQSDLLKYGELPQAPWLDVRVWSEEGRAPSGCATLSVLVQGVPPVPREPQGPRSLRGGWTEETRQKLLDAILGSLEKLTPGIRSTVLGHELLVPPDIEARFGLSGGHVYGGESALDQLLFMRPCLALSRYKTPIPGLFLGSSGSHPGGPFLGGAGILAARAVLG